MTNQIQGEILFKGIVVADSVHTPWMPVHGDFATFGIEVLQNVGGITVTWNVETRTLDDPAPPYTALYNTDQSTTSTGVDLPSSPPCDKRAKELVRYRIATGSGADATKWVMVRVLEPSWQADGR